jgi:hypothetical protein
MHRARFVFGVTALFVTTGIVVSAGQGRSGAPKPHPTSTHATPSMKPAAAPPKLMKAASAPKAPKATTPLQKPMHPVKPASQKTVKPARTAKSAPAKLAKVEKPVTTAKANKPAAAPKPSATTAPIALTPVQEKLQKNTNLASKLGSRLPPGTDLMAASAGFKNLGQFVAAVNVSSNLGIPFAQLKTSMVTDGKSLGQSIQILKPAASATIEAQHAEYDARGMIAESERQPQVTTVAAPATKAKTTPRKPAL